MRFGSLFSGIGGMDLGLERAGMECAWQVEIDEYCQKVLTKHWRDVPKFRDVRECGSGNLESVDFIAGGFPCQDISSAGKGAGLAGERSGLWFEYYRIICELRPRYALIENVSRLIINGLDRILSDLARVGYDAEWEVISACAFGAPHTRERVFIIAYPATNAMQVKILPQASRERFFESQSGRSGNPSPPGSHWKTGKPSFIDVDDGVSTWAHEVAGLGNAVVPQVAEFIGRQILLAEAIR